MHSFDQHLIPLIRQGTVCLDAARYYAANWNHLDMEMHGLMSSLPGILKPDPER